MDDEQTMNGAELSALAGERDALQAQVAELKGQVQAGTERWRDSVRTGALALALQQAGCRDVEAALRLLPGEVTVDDGGAVAGVTEAVDGLKQARAYLFAPRTAGGSANPGTGAVGDPATAFAEWLRGG